jgi:hypothetical protein
MSECYQFFQLRFLSPGHPPSLLEQTPELNNPDPIRTGKRLGIVRPFHQIEPLLAAEYRTSDIRYRV